MNVIKEEINNLYIIPEDFDINEIAKHLAIDNSRIFYIKKNNKIVGAINKNDFKTRLDISLNKRFIYFFDHLPKSEEINKIFDNNPTIIRIRVFVNNEIYCEYRKIDAPFLPKTVAKNVMALKYLCFFKEEIFQRIKDEGVRMIGIIGESKILTYFASIFPEIAFKITDLGDSMDCKIIFDFKYGTFLRKLLKASKNIVNLSEYILPIAINFFKTWVREKCIHPILIYDSVFDGMTSLSNEERFVRDNNISFDMLLKDDDYLRKFCVSKEDYCYMKNRCFNQSNAFYSDLTIKQTNVNSKFINISDGLRYSGDCLNNHSNEVHLFGPCSILGMCGPDDYTISYQLQAIFNSLKIKSKVFNHGVMVGDNLLNSLVQCLSTNIRIGDCVVIYFVEKEALNLFGPESVIWLKDILNDQKDTDEIMFFDVPGHCNRNANRIIANYIYNLINSDTNWPKSKRVNYLDYYGYHIDPFKDLNITNPDMYSHFLRLKPLKENLKQFKKIGTITMYASPFTKGHLFLVEKSLEYVDALIIFLVTDNFHTLNSIDRLEIVRRNVNRFKNVFVIPSENYFASKQYFPEYSSKLLNGKLNNFVAYQEAVSSSYLYKYLNISIRFMGEENDDEVTNEYNKVVSKCCKSNGVELVIMPRYTFDGVVISGSSARKAMKEQDYIMMKKLLTEETIEYFKEEMSHD